MANAMIGNHPSHGGCVVESIDTTAKQLTHADSGKIFMCDQNASADVLCYLPKLSTNIAGWNSKFILRTASSNDFAIVAYGSSAVVGSGGADGDSDTIVVMEFPSEDDEGAGSANSAADIVFFKASAAEVGNVIEMHTDGTKWYCQEWTRSPADVTVEG